MAREYGIWIEEPDKQVWHGVKEHRERTTFRVGCGWELHLRGHTRVWPVRPGESGPPDARRCHACVSAP